VREPASVLFRDEVHGRRQVAQVDVCRTMRRATRRGVGAAEQRHDVPPVVLGYDLLGEFLRALDRRRAHDREAGRKEGEREASWVGASARRVAWTEETTTTHAFSRWVHRYR
jgi:hypothetical protein